MKTTKIFGRLMVGCVLACCLSQFTQQTFAIEGLQVSVQQTNAILNWPSDPSETYVIQYRSNLSASASWLTLTDFYAADSSSNVTYFLHCNSVTYPPIIPGGTNVGSIDPSNTNSSSGSTNSFQSTTGFYQVVRDGAHIIGITNGSLLSGIVTMPVEVENDGGSVSTLSLTEDELPVGNSIQTAPLNSPLALVVDTTQMANGDHDISATATWEDTNGGIWEVESPAITVTVSNDISFPNWIPSFGELDNSLLIRVTSAEPSTDWAIDVYDSSNVYVGTFGGHTDDGDIQVAWDLIGPFGEEHTNDNFFSFYVTTEFSDPPAPKIYKVTDPWTATGAWAIGVQHAFDFITDHETLYEELNGFAGAAGGNGGVRPSLDGGGNPFTIHFGDSLENSSWATLRTALYNSTTRNFVYFGHGGPSGIGYNSHDTNQFISSAEIASVLHTIPAAQTNRHAFRFVFLDGCSTGKGTLPESFGIIHRENVPSIDYFNASLRPSCFCGWSADKYVGFIGGSAINYDHVNYISHIQLDMLLNGATIGQAMTYAASQPDVGFVFTSQFKLYGCPDLTLGAYNN